MKGPISENFEHKADIGVRGKGKTMEDAFVGGALSMMGVMFELKGIRATRSVDIECTAQDMEALFVEWLNKILCKRDLETMVFAKFEAKISGTDGDLVLKGKAWGEGYDPSKHVPKIEVKAATYSQLKVYKEESTGLNVVQCIVDV
jgi:SHS2 domain-containing protein